MSSLAQLSDSAQHYLAIIAASIHNYLMHQSPTHLRHTCHLFLAPITRTTIFKFSPTLFRSCAALHPGQAQRWAWIACSRCLIRTVMMPSQSQNSSSSCAKRLRPESFADDADWPPPHHQISRMYGHVNDPTSLSQALLCLLCHDAIHMYQLLIKIHAFISYVICCCVLWA